MAHPHCMLDTSSYKHTLTICITYSFALQQWLHKRVSMLRYSTLPGLLQHTAWLVTAHCLARYSTLPGLFQHTAWLVSNPVICHKGTEPSF